MATKYKPKGGEEFVVGIPSMHPGQQLVHNEAEAILKATGGSLEAYVCAHRGWWKSSFVLRRLLLHLRTGMPAAWYAPTMKPIVDTIENLFKKAIGNENWDLFYNETKKILRLPDCGPLHFYSLLEDDAGRGPTFPFMVGDEWGALPDGVHQSIVRPILRKAKLAYGGKAEGWFVGTPNAKGNPKNHFYKNLMFGKSRKKLDMMGWLIPFSAQLDPMTDTIVGHHNPYANNGYLLQDLIDDYETADRKASVLIEWLCYFISDEGSQFDRDAVEAQCSLPWEQIETPIKDTSFRPLPMDPKLAGQKFLSYRLRGHKPAETAWVQIGIDLGVNNDKVSIHVLDRMKMRHVYCHHFLPSGRDKWFMIYEAIALVARMYPGARIIVDDNGIGLSITETMRRTYGIRMEGLKFSGKNKEPILNHASSMIEKANVWLLNLQFIKDELNAVQRRARPGGTGFDIRAFGKDARDDAPMAIALMLHEVFPSVMDDGEDGDFRVPRYTSESMVAESIISVINSHPDVASESNSWHDFLST